MNYTWQSSSWRKCGRALTEPSGTFWAALSSVSQSSARTFPDLFLAGHRPSPSADMPTVTRSAFLDDLGGLKLSFFPPVCSYSHWTAIFLLIYSTKQQTLLWAKQANSKWSSLQPMEAKPRSGRCSISLAVAVGWECIILTRSVHICICILLFIFLNTEGVSRYHKESVKITIPLFL